MFIKILHTCLLGIGFVLISPIYIIIWIVSGLVLVSMDKEPLPFIPDMKALAAEQKAKGLYLKRREARLKHEKKKAKKKKAKKKAKKLAKQQHNIQNQQLV